MEERLLIKFYAIKHLILLKIQNTIDINVVYKFFDKKISGGTGKNEFMPNKELAEELHKTIIRKFEKRKVHSSFIDNI